MKYFLTLILGLLIATPVSVAQQQKSYFGGVHTPKGHLHMLVIFIRYEDKDLMPWDKNWPNTQALPKMARGKSNDLFHPNPSDVTSGPRKQNISDFYYTMSGGKFIITADIFPEQVPIKYIPENARNFFARQGQLNKASIEWITRNYPNFDWSKYDKRTNNPNYKYDNEQSGPDGIIDYVIFMHRVPGGQTGMGASSSIDIPNSNFKIRNGHTGIRVYTSKKHNWEYFKHEFAHQLYHCPHYMGANHTAGNKYYVQKGWGLMSALNPIFFTANAWERWWLGWFDPQEVSRNGTYRLKDFVTTGDAIRIPIPGSQDHLWIENHQKKDMWDERLFYNKPELGHRTTSPGIYMYVVSEPGSNRNKAQLRTFNPAHCNMMKLLNGQGLWDFQPTRDSVDNEYFRTYAIRRFKPNPIAGQNDLQEFRYDFNGDGKIPVGVNHGNRDANTGESDEIWAELIDGRPRSTYNVQGDEKDAFQSGDEVGISGIQPVLNYPQYDARQQELEPFVLNGIRIKIGSLAADGTYTLEVAFNDHTMREDQRWCGDLVLPGQFSGTDPYLVVDRGVTLDLDLSGTPSRSTPHLKTGTFANPTHLRIEPNRGIRLAPNSRMLVQNHSKLELEGNAQIIMEKNSRLEIDREGELILNSGSQIIVNKGARLIIANSGILRRLDGSNIVVKRGGKFNAKGQGRADKEKVKPTDGNKILNRDRIFN